MLELSLYLGQVFGVFMIISALVVLLAEKHFVPVIGSFLKDSSAAVIVGMIETIAGLFFVFGFQEWGTTYEAVISVMGWLILLEGLFYLVSPASWRTWMAEKFNNHTMYMIGGTVSLAFGIYLAGVGFGLL